ncbi:ATP-binding protein [Streptomyces sp. NPDC048111]|uniref:ATP-binding protein n=1 Tax=Streptomyces sp. NPDC048111 TaxID=3365500 RepID=UPI00371A2044
MLRYRVLGPTHALCPDGSEARLGGARLRALLAALAAGGGRDVPQSALVAQVWSEEAPPPADEVAALQALVGRLRKALGRGSVESAPGGYRLVAEPDEIDVFRFERLAVQGAAALAAGDAEGAVALLDEALSLWRGPAFADLPGRDGDPLVVRAERRRAEAHRNRLAVEVELGRAESALTDLADLAAAAPLDEPLQALHLRALRAAGRPAEALAAYASVREALSERLGTSPGPELAALHQELLRPGPPRTATASPRRAAVSPRPGVSRDGAGEAPVSDSRASGNLRARLTSFVGREADVRAVHAGLRQGRLVTLSGPGGAGKTRLAVEAADASAEQWQDGVWLVELAPVRDGAALAEVVLTALGARETRLVAPTETAPRDPLTQLLAHCGRLRMLIVVDNCEQVVGAVAELVEELLVSCPGVTVLATSREPLGVPGERVMAVGPLPHESALSLFGQRGAAARPDFSTSDDPEAAAEICRRLDGLPLALELAAARLRLFTPRQIADRLDDRFRLLTTGPRTSRTLQPRQQTLRAVVDWSWDLLEPAERAVLRRLAVFNGGFALREAEVVCVQPEGEGVADAGADAVAKAGAGAGVGAEWVRGPRHVMDLLGSLVDKSLVTVTSNVTSTPTAAPATTTSRSASPSTSVSATTPGGGAGEMRYGLLETVAEYARERLDEAGEREEAELRHLVAYRELVRVGEAALRGPLQHQVMGCFEVEHGNVHAALRTAVERGREQDALTLVLAMAWFWQLRGHHAEARDWSCAVADLGPDPFAEPVRRAVPLAERCTDGPPPWSEEMLWEARRGVRLMVFAASGRGEAELDSPETVAYLRRVVEAYGPGLPQNSRQPGSVWYFARLLTGEFAAFDEVVHEMVRGARRHGDAWDLGFTLLLRAKLLNGTDAEEALALFEGIGDPWGIAESLAARGETHAREGRYAEAAADFERALAGVDQMGSHAQVPVFKGRLASVRLEVARTADETAEAERMLVEAVEESRQFPGEGIGSARLFLAQHYGRTGRVELAREQLGVMEGEFSAPTPDLFRGLVAGVHGWLDCLDGKFADAQGRVRDAIRRLESQAYLVAPNLILSQFLCSAWAKAELGEAVDGARLIGAYDRSATGSESFGLRPLPAEPETRRRVEGVLRAVLGPAAYDRAYAEGAELAVREAAGLV